MKDYSKYFSMPEEFVLSYDIVDDGMLIETTTKTITTSDITKNRIKKYENILKSQYETLIEKQYEILKDKTSKIIIPFIVSSIILTMICVFICEISNLLGMIACAAAVTTTITGTIVLEVYEKLFESRIKTYKTYIKERNNIEETIKDVPKLTNGFSEETINILQTNRELKKRNAIDDIFNINFMDKASLKDLKKILEIYYNEESQSKIKQQDKTRKRTL